MGRGGEEGERRGRGGQRRRRGGGGEGEGKEEEQWNQLKTGKRNEKIRLSIIRTLVTQ